MTATNLGLGGKPVKFLGAYVINVNNNLGLAQQPSTCSVTLVEDLNQTPQALFQEPEVGSYYTLEVGSKFSFGGIVTGWTKDVKNAGGRKISVNLADPREIMRSIPVIIAPGFRNIANSLRDTDCSYLDIFGAYDDYDNTGINLSGWNQAGIEYGKIDKALSGGAINFGGFVFSVEAQAVKVFGQHYRFDVSELRDLVEEFYLVNTNLVPLSDLLQGVMNAHLLDWYVTSEVASDGYVDVKIRPIDRSEDRITVDIDNFLNINEDKIISAKKGYELRNDVACSVLFGAQVEQVVESTITGLANNPIDLSDEGGSSQYYMTEEEMRYVLGGKESWKVWLKLNGGLDVYDAGGARGALAESLIRVEDYEDVRTQLAFNEDREVDTEDEDTSKLGRIYEKLKSHAEASYGKRFLYSPPVDSETTQAAWTADVISGNNDPNEYFRNAEGKTRVYVKFSPSTSTVAFKEGLLGFAGNFALGKGEQAPQALILDKSGKFRFEDVVVDLDKSDWITRIENAQQGPTLYVSATLEEDNVVRIDSPIIEARPDRDEILGAIRNLRPVVDETDADGISTTKARRAERMLRHLYGAYGPYQKIHALAYQPSSVYLPVRSKFNRYGPVTSSNINDTQGKLQIEQDDGFSPWEFGSVGAMLDAMQFKVDNESSSVKRVESATIVVENFPQFSIGESLGLNANINSISISLSNGVTTTYQLRSFLRKFGELDKRELALLSLFARKVGGTKLPQDLVAFVQKYRPQISKQLAGKGGDAGSALLGGATSFG